MLDWKGAAYLMALNWEGEEVTSETKTVPGEIASIMVDMKFEGTSFI